MEIEKKQSIPISYNINLRINDIIAALVICFSLINGAIGIDSISYFTISVIFVFLILGLMNKTIRITKPTIYIFAFVIVIFLFSFIRVDDKYYTYYYFKYFLGFCAISLLAGAQKFSLKKVLLCIEIIGFICVSIFLVRGFDSYDASIQMGIAYSILPVFYSSLINLKQKNHSRFISLINFVEILWCYAIMAPRGIWLNIVITAILYFFVFFGKNKSHKFKIKARICILIIIFFSILFLYFYFEKILLFTSDLVFKITKDKVYALEKMIFLFNSGDLTNGRSDLVLLAQELSKGHMFFGRGIGFYEIVQGGGGYVHNIIYQSIVEAGIFFVIPLILILIYSLKHLLRIYKKNNVLEMCFFILLFSNGFVVLFYSSVYWKLLIFWFFLGYLYNYERQHRLHKRKKL